MYLQYFGLHEAPFSITPDPRFVFLSARHEDALAHLKYGITEGGGGGFVQLTGEVGTGKTTLSRCLLEDLPENITVALLLNPRLPPLELLEAICEELKVSTRAAKGSQKKLVDRLNRYLLKAHGEGRNVVLIIDEAQNLLPEALEQVRLLTNLETPTKKLLQIVLLGQPELRDLLARADLRQLAQRITARYHLTALDGAETADYLAHRLKVAGALENLFSPGACRAVHRFTGGVPRLINIVAERALVATYAAGERRVSAALVKRAADEVLPPAIGHVEAETGRPTPSLGTVLRGQLGGLAAGLTLAAAAVVAWWWWDGSRQVAVSPQTATLGSLATAPPPQGSPDDDPAVMFPGDAAATADSGTLPWTQSWEQAWSQLSDGLSDTTAATPRRGECPDDPVPPLRCRRARAGAEQLEALNRPVLIQLSATDNRYALARFADSAVEVFSSGEARWLDVGQIEALWSGLYIDLFLIPGYVPEVLREGDRGPGVLWVKAAASRSSPAFQADRSDPYFGPALRRWAEAYQTAHGLPTDGLIGLATLQRIAGREALDP